MLKQILPTDSSPTGVRYKYPKDFRKERDQAQATSKSKRVQTREAFLFLQMSKNGSVSTNRNFITVHLLPCSNLVDKWVEILLTFNENFQALLRQFTHAKNHRNPWGREGNFSGTSPAVLVWLELVRAKVTSHSANQIRGRPFRPKYSYFGEIFGKRKSWKRGAQTSARLLWCSWNEQEWFWCQSTASQLVNAAGTETAISSPCSLVSPSTQVN